MTFLNKRNVVAAAFAAVLMFGAPLVATPALAQSSQDMSLLTEQERQAFSERLQMTASSAERAKITAEMNRIVQERRLDLRRQQKQNDAPK